MSGYNLPDDISQSQLDRYLDGDPEHRECPECDRSPCVCDEIETQAIMADTELRDKILATKDTIDKDLRDGKLYSSESVFDED